MILPAEIEAVAAHVARAGAGEKTVAELRRKWPAHHFTYCLDDDIPAAVPVHTQPAFNLYLVSGIGGCLGLTTNADEATGLVIAERSEDA